jgi:fatty acid desaturase
MMKKGRVEKQSEDRIPKGYIFQVFMKPLLRRLCQTSLKMSIATSVSDWACVVACMCAGVTCVALYGWWLAIPANLFLLWPLCARAQRGFENLTHEASHVNFCRKSKKLNDLIANWFCANWVLISVEMFRKPHLRHHKHFGSEADPDRVRFGRLNLDTMPRRSPLKLVQYLLRVLPTYVLDYWRQFSDKKGQLLRSMIAHILLMMIVSYTIYGKFWLLWVAYFWIPFVFYLPVHRFFAEAEEHRYVNADTEFGSTFSNIGWFQRWILHPHGDAFHLLHHMLPQVPHWKVGFGHWILSTLDSTYERGSYRESVFDNPKRLLGQRDEFIITKGQNHDRALQSGIL